MSSTSRSSSAGLRRSVARSRYSDQQQNVERVHVADDHQHSAVTPVTAAECSRTSAGSDVVVSSTHTTPEFEHPSTVQRLSSNSLFVTLSSKPDSGGRTSSASHGRLRSSSSLFSEDNVEAGVDRTSVSCRSDRASAASIDRQSTSSTDHSSLFRLPFPQPKRANKRSGSSGSAGQSMQSPPQRAARFDLCRSSLTH